MGDERMRREIAIAAALLGTLAANAARADYVSHADLAPGTRCAGVVDPNPATAANEGCQPLLWDIPASFPGDAARPLTDAEKRGSIYYESTADRPPPLYSSGSDTPPNAPDPDQGHVCAATPTLRPRDQVPYWDETVSPPLVRCARGNRVHFGPWSHGSADWHEKTYSAVLRWNNEPTLDAEGQGREWWTYYEVYQHEGSHHANMWDAGSPCNDPDRAAYAAGSECAEFRDYYNNSSCKEDNPSPGCQAYSDVKTSTNTWRAATQFPGRFAAPFPVTDGGVQTGIPVLRGQLWPIEHHLVNKWASQKGAEHPFTHAARYGAIGEIILQFLTVSENDVVADPDRVRRLHVMFEAVIGDADIFVPPYSVGTAGSAWYAPFDLKMGLLTTHSHKRTMFTQADKLPLNPPEMAENSGVEGGENCGGNGHLFTNADWDDANTCLYYLMPSGPIAMKRGEALRYNCYFNNGLPLYEAIDALKAVDPARAQELRQAATSAGYEQEYPVKKSCAPAGFPIFPATVAEPGKQCVTDNDCAGVTTGYDDYRIPAPTCAPAPLVYGGSEDDEMCIFVGMYWRADDDPLRNAPVNRLPQSPSDYGTTGDY